MAGKIFFLLSIPEGFEAKLANWIKNINATNNDKGNPVNIESVFRVKPEYVAIPGDMTEEQNETDNRDGGGGKTD